MITLAATARALSSLSCLAWLYDSTQDLPFWIIRFRPPWFALWAVLAGMVEAAVGRLATLDRHGTAQLEE